MLEAEEIGTKDLKTLRCRDFPSGPVVKTPGFNCRGWGFDPWSGKKDPQGMAKRKS